MKRLVTMALVVLALALGAVQLLTPAAQAAGGSQCPKGTVACYGCNGAFAYCARSHAYCPECPAP
ncbi:MAG TPA: hypothetical protein VMR65_09870 [Candidatus Sulfotelmatobacter sp.]|jgi:hypothetical protein|nr:hypothetical protein [Candidatus Sulfotelmatobacter sp.]